MNSTKVFSIGSWLFLALDVLFVPISLFFALSSAFLYDSGQPLTPVTFLFAIALLLFPVLTLFSIILAVLWIRDVRKRFLAASILPVYILLWMICALVTGNI